MKRNLERRMEKYGAGSIVVCDYDPNWPILFEQESARIRQALGAFACLARGWGTVNDGAWLSRPL